MGIIKGPIKKALNKRGCVLTIGNFDGVHKGHQLILKRLVAEGKLRELPAFVLSFDPHPVKILQQDSGYEPLFSKEDLYDQARKLGVDSLILEPFTFEFSKMTPDMFLNEFIAPFFKPQFLLLGRDFYFGKEKKGSVDYIKEWCALRKIDFGVVEIKEFESKKISTTLVKKYLSEGQLRDCADILGRNYYISGRVVKGLGKGKTIGVPTANISCEKFCPKKGVYFSVVTVGGISYNSITNIGVRPTVLKSNKNITVESHLLNTNIDLYEKDIKVELLEFLREEKKFSNMDELVMAIKVDIKRAEAFFE